MRPVIKKREIHLGRSLGSGEEARVFWSLSRLSGIHEVRAGQGGAIEVEYDLAKLGPERIERVLESLGFELRAGLLEKSKGSWLHDPEQVEYDDLLASPPHCGSIPKR